MGGGGEDYLRLFVEEASFYNTLVLGSTLPAKVWAPLPHFFQSWLRSLVGGTLVYLLSSLLWCFYIYHFKHDVYIPKDLIPTRRAMLQQIKVSMKAMPWYTLFTATSEYMVETGWTRWCYPRISDVGIPAYFGYLAIYFGMVEFGLYWVHRLSHDIKPLYDELHATHHNYNKQNTVSPFAGWAFHPLDGILQALPHVIPLFLVPIHYSTHTVLFSMEVLWTANIHDCIHGNVWPVMGAGYHTIHHTTYRHNYGHYTIFMDWVFGTLRTPSGAHDDDDDDIEPKKSN